MLSQLPVDFVKIDRAVVVNALTDQAVRSVFAGITTIARESQICVVAEGIENAEMLAFVQQAGVQYAQGYLLGRPSETIPGVSALQGLNPLTYASSNWNLQRQTPDGRPQGPTHHILSPLAPTIRRIGPPRPCMVGAGEDVDVGMGPWWLPVRTLQGKQNEKNTYIWNPM